MRKILAALTICATFGLVMATAVPANAGDGKVLIRVADRDHDRDHGRNWHRHHHAPVIIKHRHHD